MKASIKLASRIEKIDSRLCIGLDPDITKIPDRFTKSKEPLFLFSKYVIDSTAECAAAYKPNSAFYEVFGSDGFSQLEKTIVYIKSEYPDVFVILDAKRGDIGSTSAMYAEAAFDRFGADAVTVSPFLGGDSLAPFLTRKDKVTVILCKTSNPGSGDIQDLEVAGEPLWKHIARKACGEWNANENVMLVVGATYPAELAAVREIVGEMPVLVPGVGAQGGDLKSVMAVGNVVVNVSRSIMYADDPQESSAALLSEMRKIRASGLVKDI